ncbi:MAG: MMPL family transporter, partial [Steroidobacteraceae bacterium]|nr:MMPL family transporter [Steroidobacteraceae bacterium]
MYSLRQRIASALLARPWVAIAVVTIITIGFGVGLRDVELKTIFSDLLPTGHPYAETYRDHPNFGNPLTVSVMIKRVDGADIYNAETLDKVWKLTRDIDLAPGVDHDQIVSIATEKARYAEATPDGVDVRPLMEDHVPATAEEVATFKRRLESSPAVRNFMVSRDGRATLVNATFIEQRLNYGEAFDYVQGLVEAARDPEHEVYLAGQPALTGWVYKYQAEMRVIFGVTLVALVLCLALYMRNLAGTVMPITAAAVSAIWGFGFIGWMKQPIEPLLMLVPLLLVARAFSHCVQITERFFEIKAQIGDRRKAAEITTRVMMAPGILGIFTDVSAISLIAIAPIPAMERFALFCGFWAIMLVPTTVFFAPVLLALLPDARNADKIVDKDGRSGVYHAMKATLRHFASLTTGRRARATGVVTLAVAVAAVALALQVNIGNPVEGSNLLRADSEFNTAIREINRGFPGVNTLEIVLEARDPDAQDRLMRQPEAIRAAQQLQYLVASGENPPRATLSFADYLMEANRLFAGGDPRWLPLDSTDEAINAAAQAAMLGSSPKAFSHVIDFEQQNGTVSFWYRDNKQETVDAALASARKAVAAVGTEHEAFTVRLGTGTIALQQAMNDTVARYHLVIMACLNLVILLGCSYAYRSVVAGLILLVPVNLSNIVISACMSLLGIGLDINSVLVASLGVGIGIDYGIYLLSRICEEYPLQDRDLSRTILQATTTTGQAIMFTATIMLVGITPWYFLSPIKFMADMGLLLSLTMLINMFMAVIVLPLLVWWVKPRFLGREDLLVTETVDLSAHMRPG